MTNTELPDWLIRARNHWRYRGDERPSFAATPKPGQVSVWDYPRPPAVAADPREVIVRAGDEQLARSSQAVKVMETASPPTFYVPLIDVERSMLIARGRGSFCEWKGEARYFAVSVGGRTIENAVWQYPEPLPGFEELADKIAFYPGLLDCALDGERVRPQPGGLYGGWITADLAGPFKGEAGSGGW